ncbi:MAG: SRPBCC family protein [Dechloromonas sp.]|nr:SRPBCC family protein [Dechloromonas sp.]
MNFEHLIAINDPNNPLVLPLSRQQIWQGLLHRVDNPRPFLPGLESCTLLERSATMLKRRLVFGPAVIEDHVTLVDQHAVCFAIQPSEQHAGGSLTITIEEPASQHFFLRFAYVTTLGVQANSEDAAYIDYVKSAYQQSDLDCVRLIRTLAADGELQ